MAAALTPQQCHLTAGRERVCQLVCRSTELCTCLAHPYTSVGVHPLHSISVSTHRWVLSPFCGPLSYTVPTLSEHYQPRSAEPHSQFIACLGLDCFLRPANGYPRLKLAQTSRLNFDLPAIRHAHPLTSPDHLIQPPVATSFHLSLGLAQQIPSRQRFLLTVKPSRVQQNSRLACTVT